MSLVPWELDITDDELPQPLKRTRNRVVNIDYLGVGTTVLPRFILVEVSTSDGATLVAEYNGIPSPIVVNDFVYCMKDQETEYLTVVGGSGSTLTTTAGYFAKLLDVTPTTPGSLIGTGGQLWKTDATETFLEPTDNPGTYSEAKGTGLLTGGELNIVSLVNIEVVAGTGLIIDSYTNPNAPPVVVAILSWDTNDAPITPAATVADVRWFTIEDGGPGGPLPGTNLGLLKQYTTEPTPTDLHNEIFLGYAVYNLVNWQEVSRPYVVNNNIMTWNEFVTQVFGPTIIQSGGVVTEDVTLFSLNQAEGVFWERNRNVHVSKTDPNREAFPAATPMIFQYVNRDFSYTGLLISVVDPSQYDNNGTVQNVGGGAGNTTIQRVYLDSADNYFILWGQNIYSSFSSALSQIGYDTSQTVIPDYLARGIFLGFVISERAETSWGTDLAQFIPAKESAFGGGGSAPDVLDSSRVSKLYNSLGTALALQADSVGNLTPGVGDTVVFKLTDTAGVSKLIVSDSADNNVAAILSNGYAGFGTDNPLGPLHVKLDSADLNATIFFESFGGLLPSQWKLGAQRNTGRFTIQQVDSEAVPFIIYNDALSNSLQIKNGFTEVGASLIIGGGLSSPIKNVSSTVATPNYSVLAADNTILCDATLANQVMDLPQGSLVEGIEYVFKKIDATANTVTLDAFSTETIDGALTAVLTTQWQFTKVKCHNSAWYIIG